jgi:hypothetical protein
MASEDINVTNEALMPIQPINLDDENAEIVDDSLEVTDPNTDDIRYNRIHKSIKELESELRGRMELIMALNPRKRLAAEVLELNDFPSEIIKNLSFYGTLTLLHNRLVEIITEMILLAILSRTDDQSGMINVMKVNQVYIMVTARDIACLCIMRFIVEEEYKSRLMNRANGLTTFDEPLYPVHEIQSREIEATQEDFILIPGEPKYKFISEAGRLFKVVLGVEIKYKTILEVLSSLCPDSNMGDKMEKQLSTVYDLETAIQCIYTDERYFHDAMKDDLTCVRIPQIISAFIYRICPQYRTHAEKLDPRKR